MWRSYTKWSVTRIARKDGRRYRWVFWPFWSKPKAPMPPDGSAERATFEFTLCQAAEADMQKLAKNWQVEDQKLFAEYCKALEKVKELEKKYAEEDREAKQASDEYVVARKAFQAIDPPPMERHTAWLILIAIMAAEFVFNMVVFEIFLRDKWETWLMGVMPLLIPFLGDWLGGTIRQQKTRPLIEKGLIFVVCLLGLVATFAIAWVRSAFIEASEVPRILNISVTPWQFSMIFMTFNLILFVASIIIGYHSTPTDRNAHAKARRDLQVAAKDFAKEENEAKQWAGKLDRARRVFTEAKTRRETRFGWYQERAKEIKEEHDFLVGVYRDENTRARGGQPVPAFDLPLLEPALPQVLGSLNWNCGGPTSPLQARVPNQQT